MRETTHNKLNVIATSQAMDIASAAMIEGERVGVSVSVAICDPLMGLVVFAKADGATPHSAHTSRRKAQTAASTRKPTGWMSDQMSITLPLASGNRLTNVGGGFPIRFGGEFIGAIGVAGGTVEQDIAIAQAALRSVGADATQ